MDIESKIWRTSDTGIRVHVFVDGTALCRKSIKLSPYRESLGEGYDYCEAHDGVFKVCASCDKKFNAAIEAAEVTPAPAEASAETGGTQEKTVATSKELLKAREQGAEVRYGSDRVEYSPRYKGDRLPWLWTGERESVRYPAGYCRAVFPSAPVPVEVPAEPVKRAPRVIDPKPVGSTPITVNKEDELSSRAKEGPLTAQQIEILDAVSSGKTHGVVARQYGMTRGWVSNHMVSVVAKMKTRNSAESIAIYTRHKAFLDVADMLLAARVRHPVDAAEDHVNHVLTGLAETYRAAARNMLPE